MAARGAEGAGRRRALVRAQEPAQGKAVRPLLGRRGARPTEASRRSSRSRPTAVRATAGRIVTYGGEVACDVLLLDVGRQDGERHWTSSASRFPIWSRGPIPGTRHRRTTAGAPSSSEPERCRPSSRLTSRVLDASSVTTSFGQAALAHAPDAHGVDERAGEPRAHGLRTALDLDHRSASCVWTAPAGASSSARRCGSPASRETSPLPSSRPRSAAGAWVPSAPSTARVDGTVSRSVQTDERRPATGSRAVERRARSSARCSSSKWPRASALAGQASRGWSRDPCGRGFPERSSSSRDSGGRTGRASAETDHRRHGCLSTRARARPRQLSRARLPERRLRRGLLADAPGRRMTPARASRRRGVRRRAHRARDRRRGALRCRYREAGSRRSVRGSAVAAPRRSRDREPRPDSARSSWPLLPAFASGGFAVFATSSISTRAGLRSPRRIPSSRASGT